MTPMAKNRRLPVRPSDDPCRGCGACCLHLCEPPFFRMGEPEWERLQRERPDLVAEIDATFVRRHPQCGLLDDKDRAVMSLLDDDRFGGPCTWYDAATRRCRHYEYRPRECREFEPGSKDCRRTRRNHGID